MTTKMVYFTVGGKPEQAEFSSDFPADEIKGTVTVFTCTFLLPSMNRSVLLALFSCRFCFIQLVVLFIITAITV